MYFLLLLLFDYVNKRVQVYGCAQTKNNSATTTITTTTTATVTTCRGRIDMMCMYVFVFVGGARPSD